MSRTLIPETTVRVVPHFYISKSSIMCSLDPYELDMCPIVSRTWHVLQVKGDQPGESSIIHFYPATASGNLVDDVHSLRRWLCWLVVVRLAVHDCKFCLVPVTVSRQWPGVPVGSFRRHGSPNGFPIRSYHMQGANIILPLS